MYFRTMARREKILDLGSRYQSTELLSNKRRHLMPNNPNAVQTWYIYPISSHTHVEKSGKTPLFGVLLYIHHCSSYPVTFSHLFGLDVKKLPSAQNCAPENDQPWPAPSCYSLPATLADSVALHLGLVNGCRRSRVCAG